MHLVSTTEMIAIEKAADASGLGYDQMMQNAGTSLAKIINKRYGGITSKSILGLVGSGNNGGDTLIALTILQKSGWQVTGYLAKKRNVNDALIGSLIKSGGKVIKFENDQSLDALIQALSSCGVLMDGILGTGIKLPLRGHIPEILKVVTENIQDAIVVAVDVPSGIDCDSGKAANAVIKADMTVCMAAVKQGMLEFPAIGMMGEIVFADIGLPEKLFADIDSSTRIADASMIAELLPSREADSYKGTFGTCMIIGGSTQFCGAPILAARAAYRVGAGLVRTCIPGAIYDAVAGQVLESTWLMLPHSMGTINADAVPIILANLNKVKALLVGPGMGLEKEIQAFLDNLLKFNRQNAPTQTIGFTSQENPQEKARIEQPTIVFDADALRILPEIDKWHEKLTQTAVLTPHPGEMAALTGLKISDIQKNRIGCAREYAQKVKQVIVLKGAKTVVASPKGEVTIIPIATAALATAGSGDVLAGMITGLIAQGVKAYDAAVAGCWMHAIAGLAAEKVHGQSASVIASDIIELIPSELKKNTVH